MNYKKVFLSLLTDDSLAFKGFEAKTCIAGREVCKARVAAFLAAIGGVQVDS